MTLEELENLADVDLKINDTELDIESLKIPQLHNKYSKFHNQFINLLKKSEQNRDILIREKWEYYTGKASPTVYQAQPFNLKILRQDVDKYIDSDEEVIIIPIIKAPIRISYFILIRIIKFTNYYLLSRRCTFKNISAFII